MGAELQNLYQVGTAAWSIKYYKEKILSALTQDLARREAIGIEKVVCDTVYDALNESVVITRDLEERSLFVKNFYDHLSEFKDLYKAWNDVKGTDEEERGERRKRHKALMDCKSLMFQDFLKEMKRLEKTHSSERLYQYQLLTDTDKDMMDKLNYTFNSLAHKYGNEIFISLRKGLTRYNKKNARKRAERQVL